MNRNRFLFFIYDSPLGAYASFIITVCRGCEIQVHNFFLFIYAVYPGIEPS